MGRIMNDFIFFLHFIMQVYFYYNEKKNHNVA